MNSTTRAQAGAILEWDITTETGKHTGGIVYAGGFRNVDLKLYIEVYAKPLSLSFAMLSTNY